MPSVGSIKFFNPYKGPNGGEDAYSPRHAVTRGTPIGGGGPEYELELSQDLEAEVVRDKIAHGQAIPTPELLLLVTKGNVPWSISRSALKSLRR